MTLISADAHIVEPPGLWEERLDRGLRDRAPRIEQRTTAGVTAEMWIADGMDPLPVGGFLCASAAGDDLVRAVEQGYGAAPASVFDPTARLQEQDVDGVSAEVLYNTWCMMLFHLDDVPLRQACFRAYNDYAAEYCAVAPERLLGIGAVDVTDPESAAAELERIVARGLRGASITCAPPSERPFSDPSYDVFWATAQDLGLPVSLHTGTGRRGFDPGRFTAYIVHPFEIQLSLAEIILGGVFDRFPDLAIVSAEADISWLPHLMYRMDHNYEKFDRMRLTPLKQRPSDYVRNCEILATFQFEDMNVPWTAAIAGAERLAWATDYPHLETRWPNSRASAAESVANLSATDAELVTAGNVRRVYHLA